MLLVILQEAHPKCICSVCDFTAEHAYVIKRHMMRHSAEGCECELCGKRYKVSRLRFSILNLNFNLVSYYTPSPVVFLGVSSERRR